MKNMKGIKKMKKIFAFIAVLSLLLVMSTSAFAAAPAVDTDVSKSFSVDKAVNWTKSTTGIGQDITDATNQAGSAGRSIFTLIQSVAYIVGFILLSVYGLKWWFVHDDAQKLRSLKSQAIYYVVGCLLTFGTGFVFKIIASFVAGFS